MYEALEDYIIQILDSYENDKKDDLEYFNQNKIFHKLVDSKTEFVKLLDKTQTEAFMKYSRILIAYEEFIKSEYFSAGFVHGLYTDKSEFEQ